MKRALNLFVVMTMILIPMGAYAEWYNEIKFVVGSGASTPVSVRYGGKTYTVYSSTTITTTGNTYSPSATDANGNSMKYEVRSSTQSSGSDTYHYYIYTFYPRSSSSSGSNGGYYGGGYSNNNGSNSGAIAGQAIGSAIFFGGGGVGDAYPSLQLMAGVSRAYGENLRLRWASYSGFQIYASIGKDFFFDSKYSDKIRWNAGMGSYFGFGGNGNHNMDLGLGLSVGQQAQWKKLCFMIDVDYTIWLGRWRRVGLFAGGGLGWGNFTNVFDSENVESSTGFAWNIEAGIVLRIANF